jgi:hypothetical protein
MEASYTKLRSGEWGVRIQGGTIAKGTTVQVRKKSGEVRTETVACVVWSGKGVTLAAIEQHRRRSSGERKGRWTGCSCGSREDEFGDLIPSERNCRQCEFDA